MICLRTGKTTEAKSHRLNLRSPLPRIHYYQKKLLQVKGIPLPNTKHTVEPLPQYPIRLVLLQQSLLSMYGSQYVTNQCYTDPSTWLTHQLKEAVGCKVLQFIQQWWSKSSLVTKPLAQRRSSFYKEYDELGQIVSGHTMHV